MGFQPEVNTTLTIQGKTYTIGEHPNAPSIPYGQEGRQGIVYLLHTEDRRRKKALKVFRGKFVNPSLVHHTQQIAKYAGVEGLAACERFIITPQLDTELLRTEPDLLYAVVMAWIEGPTWMDMLLGKKKLSRRERHAAAYALAQSLAALEQRGLAHGDLSAPNVMLPMFGEKSASVRPIDYVQLIDLEQLYAAHLDRPEQLSAGSPGYAPKLHSQFNPWGPQTDRFAGAVLLVEMLAACSDTLLEHIWGESFFAPEELQANCDRYRLLLEVVRQEWGEAVASLFVRAWESREMSECPAFGEWLIELAKLESKVSRTGARDSTDDASAALVEAAAASEVNQSATGVHDSLLKRARHYEAKGKLREAIDVYRTLLQRDPHPSLAKEVELAIDGLEERRAADSVRKQDRSRRRLSVWKRWLIAVALIGGIGIGGYYAGTYIYDYLKQAELHAKTATPDESVLELKQKIASLEAEVAAKSETIEELNARIETLGKPMDEKNESLRLQLSQYFEQIRKSAAAEPNSRTDPVQLTFDAADAYMNHFYAYLRDAYYLDQYLIEQLQLVEGYYYPFIYNHNRNSQLNIRFFNDYKTKITGEVDS